MNVIKPKGFDIEEHSRLMRKKLLLLDEACLSSPRFSEEFFQNEKMLDKLRNDPDLFGVKEANIVLLWALENGKINGEEFLCLKKNVLEKSRIRGEMKKVKVQITRFLESFLFIKSKEQKVVSIFASMDK